jgi:hypothetical protein
LLHSATNTHIQHLQTRSFAQHEALGEFYDEIVDLTDALIEIYQGKNKTIVKYPETYTAPTFPPVEGLEKLRNYLLANRAVIGTESNVQNELDNIISLVERTIYKLTFLS